MAVRQVTAGKRPIVVRLTDGEYQAIVDLAARDNVSHNEYMAELCRKAIARNGRKKDN